MCKRVPSSATERFAVLSTWLDRSTKLKISSLVLDLPADHKNPEIRALAVEIRLFAVKSHEAQGYAALHMKKNAGDEVQ